MWLRVAHVARHVCVCVRVWRIGACEWRECGARECDARMYARPCAFACVGVALICARRVACVIYFFLQ